MKNGFCAALNIFAILHTCSTGPSNSIQKKKIILEDRYNFVVVGSDHVAQSIGFHLAKGHKSKSILVLQSNQCDQILEPARASNVLALQISDMFAHSAHLMGYDFTDPFRHGQRVGIGYKNRTRGLDTGQQTLWAIDPNLVLLSGATVVRLLYNHAAASIHGVELELDGTKQCIFAVNEVIIAGRCMNDYHYLSRGSIVSETALESCLRMIPLNCSLGSPVMAPIFQMKTNVTLEDDPMVLGTELYVRTPEFEDEERMKPNARLRIAIGKSHLHEHVWVGFVPSLISVDPHYNPSHEETVKMLGYVLKTANAITSSEIFRQLNMTVVDQSVPECVKYENTQQFWTCVLDLKLRRYKSLHSIGKHKATLLEKDFRLKGVRSLRLLPFGLSAPFLNHQWIELFPVKS
ncbi:uncharacterized protein LOC134224195 [Armigeres subalbatus]|uniref:uncharacterized protein LOC134224195 n=1 Tax=Armigeres subalbatus TaxID=124917 RepID=UPI002ED3DAB1